MARAATGHPGVAGRPSVVSRYTVVRVDDSGECCRIGFRSRIGVCGPDQLVAADALAGCGHATKTEIGRVGQYCGEKCAVIVATLARAQIGEDRREAGRSVTSCNSSVMRTAGSNASTRSAKLRASGGGDALQA
jgi:hypothetical protein